MVATKTRSLESLIDHDIAEVEELLAAQEYNSVFEDYGDFQLLILRRMRIHEKALSFSSEAFLTTGKSIYMHDHNASDFILMKGGLKELLKLTNEFYNENRLIITAYSFEIDKLENQLFDRDFPSYFMDLWFDIKKDLSRMESFYFRNGMVYREFLKRSHLDFGIYKDDFKDIEENIQLQATSILNFKGRLDGVHNYHNSIKSDRLNKTLLLLTLISGIFLPLNLIVGFFGMNTSDLFFATGEQGTEKVLIILAGVLFLCLLGLKTFKSVDLYFLRFVLGRYNFYKSLHGRIEEIDKGLKGK